MASYDEEFKKKVVRLHLESRRTVRRLLRKFEKPERLLQLTKKQKS